MAIAEVSSRTLPDADLEQVAQLAMALSHRLARVPLEDIDKTIAAALSEVAAAISADECQLLEFSELGAVVRVHVPAPRGERGDAPSRPGSPERWLLTRLLRDELVAIAGPEDAPAGERGRRLGGALLGVPATVGGQVIAALVIESGRVRRRWPQPLVERLQLVAEILGAAVQHVRHEGALRSNVSVIERLNSRLEADNVYLKEEIKGYHDFDEIVGDSAPLQMALKRLGQVAPTNSTVLLLGPTGTGKELFARALHERSRRHARPLVRVNCAALPPTLVESELFGHEKGAFTGAVGARQGRFELADGGTIFLDEIGDLAPEVQVKFLRVLQEGEFERVGSSRTKRVDVRVIAATHQNLETAVAEGRFRADLYYRLSVYPIHLPSLQERPEDIPQLVWFFINRYQRELARHITKVPPAVVGALQQYAWPGNVRELENVVERALIASSGDTLELDGPLAFSPRLPAPAAESDNLDALQRGHIVAVLERCRWRINGAGNAAERLGLHPNTLRFRMKKLGICPADRGRPRSLRA